MRNFFHVVISLLMWCLFGYYWLVVSRRQITRSSIEAMGILAVIIIIGLILTIWWVAHNKKLARRNRRRSTPATIAETFDADYLGRTLIRPDVKRLQAAQIIDIEVEKEQPGECHEVGRKIYRIADGGDA